MQPKVSVIVSAYNSENFIRESIESIISQSLNEIEIVIIYKFSTDKTVSILQEYALNDTRIKMYAQTGTTGCGPAKNQGIKAAIGEFITFMDADDFYSTNDCLEKLYKAAKKQNAKICGGLRSFKMIDGTIQPNSLHRKILKKHPDGVLLRYLDYQFDYHFHSYLYDRNFIIKNDFQFGTWLVYDDCHFHAPAMFMAKEFFVIPVETYCYRLHGPYDWSYKETMESVIGFTDMLKFSKRKKLAILHWITFCRMNQGAFHTNFVKNIDNILLFNALVQANSYIDSNLINKVQNNMPGDDILDPMGLPNKKQIPLENGDFILKVLLYVFNNFKYKDYSDELIVIRSSMSFKIGRCMTFIPRACRMILRSLKKNGIFMTIKICKTLLVNKLRRKS